MQAQDIEDYLTDLGDELQTRGLAQPLRILIVGGAYMLIEGYSRPPTQDIDVLLRDIDDPTTSPTYPVFRAAILTVANRRLLPPTWINDVIGDALRAAGTIPSGTLWRTFRMLEAYLPPSDYMLALKLFAGRPKDRQDIMNLSQHLGIRSRDEAQEVIDRYIPSQQLQQLNHVGDILDELYP